MEVSVIFMIYLHLVNSVEEIERSDGEDDSIDVEESSALGRVGWRVARQQHLFLLCEFTHYWSTHWIKKFEWKIKKRKTKYGFLYNCLAKTTLFAKIAISSHKLSIKF